MEADKQTVDSQLDNALNALARGFAVFPCEPRSKRPAGKVVPNGVKQASTDEATIRGWWKINPDFNPAITGGVIVDADSGLNSLKEATNFALLNDFPPTLIVRTGRRDSYGAQFHFSGTAVNGLYTANGVAGEIRCKNEYGMAPGAIHPITGERYEIVVDLRRAVCPSDLLKNFRKSSPSPKEPNAGFKVGEGERFYWLRSQCGRLVNAGLSGAALFAALKSLNEKFCEPPKPDSVLQELADAGTAKFSANVQPPPSQRRKVYGEERIRFLTEKAERFYRPNFPEHLMYYELSDHNAVSCVPPLPRGELRHLSVHVYERLSGETVRTYPGMFEDDEQNATDTGYGKHFIRDHGSFVRYNSETREWLTYWKGVWRVTHDDVAVARYFKEQWIEREKAVKASLASLAPGVSAIDAKEAGDSKYVISMLESSILELYKNEKRKLAYALNGQESRNINSALELARTEDGIQISNVDLDSDPLLFNCLNMALDLRTSEPVQHRIDLLCTKQSPVTTSTRASSLMEDYEEDVCPEFERILSRSLPDESTREYLQDFFGLCLSGLMVPDILIFLGDGSNGKSLIRTIIAGVLGRYAGKAAMSTFTVSKNVNPGGARTDLAGFRGVRLITASEANRRVMLDLELLKDWTGNEEVNARDLWQKGKNAEFKPQGKILLLMNHPPRIIDQSQGTWRRLRYVHFTVEIPRSEWNEQLGQDVLDNEGSGVLRWMLTGWERVRARLERGEPGLVTPQKITDDTAAFREKESAVSRFFEEHLEAKAGWKMPAARVYECYVNWCKQTNEFQESATELTLSIQRYCADQGYPLETGVKTSGVRNFVGLAFKASAF